MLGGFSSFILSPSLLLTSLKESFESTTTTTKVIFIFEELGSWGSGGGGKDKAVIGKGKRAVGSWEGGGGSLTTIKGIFASCLFPSSGVCKLFSLVRTCVRVRRICVCVCVCAHGCRHESVCVCKHVLWGGGFCNVFCRMRTQMTFNWQCFGGE